MRILVTNDDGIESPGLAALVRALHQDGHDLMVAAPMADRSGSGSALGTLEHGASIAYRPHHFDDVPDVPAWAVDAPPSFSTLAFCTGSFGPRPDLVVSGINAGHNTGRLVLNSSTVGAVLTAHALGVRGVALSTGFPPGHRFDTASLVAVAVVRWMRENPQCEVLNVNVPDLDAAEVRGVRVGRLAKRGLMGLGLERSDTHIRLRRFTQTERLGFGTDSALVSEGYVALTVLRNVGHDPVPDEALEQQLAAQMQELLGAAHVG